MRRLFLVVLAAAGTFALTKGGRQSMDLFFGKLNSDTALGLPSFSLGFASGQRWWGLTPPRRQAMAAGLVMMLHEVGGSMGIWRGGTIFQAQASFKVVSFADIVLVLVAALLHLPIREQRPAPLPAAVSA